MANAYNALIDEHAKAVKCRASPGFAVDDKLGSRRIGDDIGNDHMGLQTVRIDIQPFTDIRI
ncbi:hypothetical protein D3C75_1162610 [compost metagenome]